MSAVRVNDFLNITRAIVQILKQNENVTRGTSCGLLTFPRSQTQGISFATRGVVSHQKRPSYLTVNPDMRYCTVSIFTT